MPTKQSALWYASVSQVVNTNEVIFVAFLSQFLLRWCVIKIPGGEIRNSDIKNYSMFFLIQCKLQF